MVVVNESHKLISVAVGSNVPGLLGFLEVETYYRTVVFACNGIAFTVAVHKVASVLAVNHAAALGHGIASAPEFNGIEHENIGERGNLIYGKNPEGEEHEFVYKFISNLLVPAQKFVGK